LIEILAVMIEAGDALVTRPTMFPMFTDEIGIAVFAVAWGWK